MLEPGVRVAQTRAGNYSNASFNRTGSKSSSPHIPEVQRENAPLLPQPFRQELVVEACGSRCASRQNWSGAS